MIEHEILTYLRDLNFVSISLRLVLALFLGGAIGFERGRRGRAAGFRTHIIVCLGATMATMTGQFIIEVLGLAGDPARLGAQVISGIGFLGVGTILVTGKSQVRGLTTAAGLWSTAAVGLSIGIGFYEAALTASIGIYGILAILQRWEHRVHKKVRLLDVYIELENSVTLSEFIQGLRNINLKIEGIQFEPDSALENNTRAIVFTLKSPKKEDHFVLLKKIRELNGIVHLEEL